MLKLVALLLTVSGLIQASVLEDFQQQFADHSQLVQPEIHAVINENHHARLGLIRWILAEIGNLTLDMRTLTDDTWAEIENHELFHEGCRAQITSFFGVYVRIGEWDIQYCARDMDDLLREDAASRFTPSVGFINRENTRSTFQTVQTLGRHRFTESLDEVSFELQDELDYFHNLWEGYQPILREEIEDIAALEELVRAEMAWWYDYAIEWHKANWFKAVEYCNYLGARLAIVASYENQTELAEMVQQTDKYNSISTEFWIGASDLADEGHFIWHATGTRVQYSNWKVLQPDNGGNVEHCVEVRYIPSERWDWQWNDLDCKKMRYFVCEYTDVVRD
ncbi:hypothetical protein quinque_003727 [Culex quinquefasciatus]